MIPIRSTTVAALASVVLAGMLTGCQFGEEQQDSDLIVIGVDLELSGAAATTGRAHKQALELKAEQLNSSGELGGRKVELKIKDNGSDPAQSRRNITAFSSDSSMSGIIMGGCNACAVGAAKVAEDKKIPTITLAAADATVNPVADRRYVFKLGPNATDSAAILAEELKSQKAEKVTLLHSDDTYGQEGLVSLTNELRKLDIDLVRAAAVSPNDRNLTAKVKSLTTEKVDAMVIWTPPEQAVLAANSAQQAKFDGSLFFDAASAGELFLSGTGAKALDEATMVFTQTMVIDDVIANTPAKAARRQWFRDYTARFGGYHGFSSFAADALQLLAEAAVKTKSTDGRPDRTAIRDVLETSQVDGLSGPIRMTPDNHSGLRPQALTTLVARGGRWRMAG